MTPPDGASHSSPLPTANGFLNADQCSYEWQTIAFNKPNDAASGSVVLASSTDHGRSLAPGASASWDGWGPPAATGRGAKKTLDATRLIIKDATGRVIKAYVWPAADLERRLDQSAQPVGSAKPAITESGDTLTATTGSLSLQISKTTGLLVSASRQGKAFSLANGPRVLAMGPRLAAPRRQKPSEPLIPPPTPPVIAPGSKLTSLTHEADGNDLVISAAFEGPMRSLIYRLKPDGWLSVDYIYAITGPQEYFGIGFDYPEPDVKGMRFLAKDPPRSIRIASQAGLSMFGTDPITTL